MGVSVLRQISTRWLVAAALVGLVATGMVAGSWPEMASAYVETDPSPDDASCDIGDFCGYNYYNYNSYGGVATWDGNDRSYTDYYPNMGPPFPLNNSIQSIRNRGNQTVYMFVGANWTDPTFYGLALALRPLRSNARLDDEYSGGMYPVDWFNNSISSHGWGPA